MFSQDRKYSGSFRFSRVLVLILLLTSPTRAISVPESCVKIANALMENPTPAVVIDTKFLANLVDCLGANGVIPQKLRDLILKLPDMIDKVLPSNTEKGLVLLSAYLAYRSYELYDRAMKVEENYKKYRHEFEELQEKIKPVLKSIREQLIPQLKDGDTTSMLVSFAAVFWAVTQWVERCVTAQKTAAKETTSMQNTIEKLLRMLGGFSTKLRELSEAIHRDVTLGESHKRWISGYAAATAAVCVSSIFVAGPISMAVGIAGVSFAICVICRISLGDSLTKLDLLWGDTANMRKVLAKYWAYLQLATINHEVPFLDIHIRSEGCDDPGRKPSTCGFAYIEVNGKDYSPHLRGYNVVVVDCATGDILEVGGFDTCWNSYAGVRLREYLNGINGNKIVLVAIQGEGSNYMTPAIDALKRLGATDTVQPGYRGSFALVGYAGENKPLWITQKGATRGLGPSEISLKIPL